MNVTFCGHSQIWKRKEVEKWLFNVTKKLIQQGATTFYLGGYGTFDSLAASVLRELKKGYPQIELILVLAYLNTSETLQVMTVQYIRHWKLYRAVLQSLIGTAGW